MYRVSGFRTKEGTSLPDAKLALHISEQLLVEYVGEETTYAGMTVLAPGAENAVIQSEQLLYYRIRKDHLLRSRGWKAKGIAYVPSVR